MPDPRAAVLLVLALLAPVSAAAAGELGVTYLANEGFLLDAGGATVVIDAFVPEPYSIYAGLDAEAWRRMLAAEAPFEKIDLALVSHRHRDHFQPDAAAAFLEAHPEALLATSPQVLGLLPAELPDAARKRTRALRPEAPAGERVERAGVRVEALALRHGGERHREVQNLGHVIHLGGKKVLHVGDVAMEDEVFAPYRLAERGIDVSLVPYWFFLSAGGRTLVERHLRGRVTVAVHVPPRELAEVRKHLASEAPEVLLFERSLERRAF